jgi:hypothetical protein
MLPKVIAAAVCAALWLVALLLGGAEGATGDGSYIYGLPKVSGTRWIREVNPILQTSADVYDTGIVSSVNGEAFDIARNQFIFLCEGNNDPAEAGMWVFDMTYKSLTQISTSWEDLVPDGSGMPQNAAFYDNGFWCAYECVRVQGFPMGTPP